MLSNMNGMNGPLIVGACGGGIPVASVPVVPVGAMNDTDQGNQNSLSSMGNGSGDLKYNEKKRINQGQNKNINRKLPSNGAQRMVHQLATIKSNIECIKIPKYWFNKGHVVILSYNMLWYLAAEKINKMSKKLKAILDECLLDLGSDSDDGRFLGEVTAKSKRVTSLTISDSSSEDESRFRNKRIKVDNDSDDSSEEERRRNQWEIKPD